MINSHASKGIIYIAFGERYINEARFSAACVKKVSDVPITLFTDQEVSDPSFDTVTVFEPQHKRAKVDMLEHSPYERTLYLDSDTRVLEDIAPLFDLLDRVDIAAAQDQVRYSHRWSKVIPEYAEIPEAFSELNAGVLLYRKSSAASELFATWREVFYTNRELTNGQDQASFRIALWKANVQFMVLGPEWNRRNVALLRRVKKQAKDAGQPSPLRTRIRHWHGVEKDRPWNWIEPRYRPTYR